MGIDGSDLATHCVNIANLNDIFLDHLFIKNAVENGVECTSTTSQLMARDLEIKGCGEKGMDLSALGDSKLVRCNAYQNTEMGIQVGATTQVERCHVYQNGTSGMRLSGDRNQVTNVRTNDNDEEGFIVAGDENSITNLLAYDNGQGAGGGMTQCGLRFASGVVDNKVFGLQSPISSSQLDRVLYWAGTEPPLNYVAEDGGRFGIDIGAFGATRDGSTDDRGAIDLACTAAATNGVPLILSAGTYRIGSALTIPAGTVLQAAGGILQLDDGVALTVSCPIDVGNVRIFDDSRGIPINAQTHADYDNDPVAEGTFVGGSGYNVNDVITLTDGTEVTVTAESSNVVTGFTVDSSGSDGTVQLDDTLTQDSVAPAGGTGFTLTVSHANHSHSSSVSIPDGPVNICWWGAVADASTPCSPAIQSAVDTTRDVYIPATGTRYHCHLTISITDPEQRIFGDGWETSTLRNYVQGDVTNNYAALFDIDDNFIVMEKMKIVDGRSDNVHIRIENGRNNCIFEKIKFDGGAYQIYDIGNQTTLRDVEFQDYEVRGYYQAGTGIPATSYGADLKMSDCFFHVATPTSGMAHCELWGGNPILRNVTFGDGYTAVKLTQDYAGTEYYSTSLFLGCRWEELEHYEIEVVGEPKGITVIGGRMLGNLRAIASSHWTLQGIQFHTKVAETRDIYDIEGSTWTIIDCPHLEMDDFSVGDGEKIFLGRVGVYRDTDSPKYTHGTDTSLTAVWDFSVHGGSVSDISLAEIPEGCRVISGQYEVLTALTSGGSATVAFGVDTDDATGLLLATPYDHEDFDTDESHEFIPDGQANTFTTATTATREVIMTIAGADLTAGKIRATIRYKKMV
jgi:hypothetical protein